MTGWRFVCDQSARDARAADRAAALLAAGPAFTIIRVFDAPRELVWKEWTEPARFADWFGGADVEVPLSSVSIDPRPGGSWSATTLAFGPGGSDIRWTGRYLEIEEPERIAFTICGLADRIAPDIATVTLADLGEDQTEMSFHQYGRRTADEYELARQQWSVEFDRVTERLLDAWRRPHSF